MRKKLYISFIFITIICYINIHNSWAQNNIPLVEISKQHVLINGKAYYLHTVQKGQTLYSIARTYGCSIDDIVKENSLMDFEIKAGQNLKIPIIENTTQIKEATDSKVIHVVSGGQTLYSIARMYGVKPYEIMQANALISDTIKVNQQLLIPIEKVEKEPEKLNCNNCVKHKIIEKETLYSISRSYNVPIKLILKYNPSVTENLKIGDEIVIPIQSEPDSFPEKKDFFTLVNCDSIKCKSLSGRTLNISLLLPLYASTKDITSDSDQEDETNENRSMLLKNEQIFHPLSKNFIEFYQGILLAVDELRKEGLNMHLNIFDTENSVEKIKEILLNPEVKKSTMIIGPIFPDQIPLVAEYALQNKIYQILPLGNYDGIDTNAYVIQLTPNLLTEVKNMVRFLQSDSIKKILIVYDTQSNNHIIKDEIGKLKDKGKSVKEFNVYRYDLTEFLNQIDSSDINYVLSFSNNEIFVNTLLGKIETKLLYYPIRTIGMAEWIQYRSIDLNYLYNQQFTCFSSYYVDYQKENVLKFLKKYRLTYGSEPLRTSRYGFNYSMLGFDLIMNLAAAYGSYGDNFPAVLSCFSKHSLITRLNLTKISERGGWINNNAIKIQFLKHYDLMVQ